MPDETAKATGGATPPPTPPGVTPCLIIRDGRGQEAANFCRRAFGARELFRNLASDGRRLLHCRLEINGSVVMFSDDFPDMRDPFGHTWSVGSAKAAG